MTVSAVLMVFGGSEEHLALLLSVLQSTERDDRDGFGGLGGCGGSGCDGYPP